MVAPRAIIHFIDELLGTVRDNILADCEKNKRLADGTEPLETETNAYMEMSPDLDSPAPLTQ